MQAQINLFVYRGIYFPFARGSLLEMETKKSAVQCIFYVLCVPVENGGFVSFKCCNLVLGSSTFAFTIYPHAPQTCKPLNTCHYKDTGASKLSHSNIFLFSLLSDNKHAVQNISSKFDKNINLRLGKVILPAIAHCYMQGLAD